MVEKNILVTKASGETELYDREKIRKSIIGAGAGEQIAERILREVDAKLYNGITTEKIFKMVFKLLSKHHPSSASRFDLKGAIMRIGPAGYPFETFFSEVMREYGYEVKLRQIVQGRCVPHEIDVVAKDKKKTYMVECKYHNNRGTRSNIHDGLYTWARFLDLEEGAAEGKCEKFDQPWLVTNTKLTSEVIEYGNCRGLEILGWSYPQHNNLRMMVESKNLYPVTVLRSVDKFSLEKLFIANIMLAKDLLKFQPRQLSSNTNIPPNRAELIIDEAMGVLRVNE